MAPFLETIACYQSSVLIVLALLFFTVSPGTLVVVLCPGIDP
jgi:hypothetical protein